MAYYALVSVKAGLASVILSLSPIATLFAAAAHGQEKLEARGVVGGTIAVGGTAVVFNEQLSLAIPLSALVALLGANVAIAETSVSLKHFPRTDPYGINAVGMFVGSAILLGLSAVTGEHWVLPMRNATIVSVAYLILPGSVLLFILYLYVISRWSASATNYGFVMIPLVTVLVASSTAGESASLTFLAGTALVLIGVYFGALSRSFSSRPSPGKQLPDSQNPERSRRRPGVPEVSEGYLSVGGGDDSAERLPSAAAGGREGNRGGD